MVSNIASPNLDDLLLDIATGIELSDRDRRVAENRYRTLKDHLERKTSPLAPYLSDSESRIYAQGSIATGTTVVSGIEDDRFDLDALVELCISPSWSPNQVMDLLHEALKDFPDALEVVRCTRCVQIRFAFMHMDVTVLDPQRVMLIERAGEIFHSPHTGEALRIPSNPYGFAKWFRQTVHVGTDQFRETLTRRRATGGIDRLSFLTELKAATQDDLPPILPSRLDSEQVVALKLLKRYLNVRYENRRTKKPPSIYISKLAVDVENPSFGLCAQLEALASHIESEMHRHLADGQIPDERNPSYPPDRLNDRWPKTPQEMEILAKDMKLLLSEMARARQSDFGLIAKIVSEMFGHKIGNRATQALLNRASQTGTTQGTRYEQGIGTVVLDKAVIAPSLTKTLSIAPRHSFHDGFA